ncbi:hypothetical protein LDENG_00125430 [Lucifuga dentata]|nr:hypothetical protein LDENG_00125430 [Lucifuga dentata]
MAATSYSCLFSYELFSLSSDEEWQPPATPALSTAQSTSAASKGQRKSTGDVGPSTSSPLPITSAPKVTKKRNRDVRSEEAGAEKAGDSWHDASEEDEQPQQPNFAPKRPVGPQLIPGQSYSPLQLFQLYFSDGVLHTIIENTHKFAEKRTGSGKKYKWLPLTLSEMYGYIMLVIYMGLVKLKDLHSYWSKKRGYNLPFLSAVMSRVRFLAITWPLHLCDPVADEQNQAKKGTNRYDPLFKLKPLYDEMLSSCRSFYQPDRHIAIDEWKVATKACTGFKQYMKQLGTGYRLCVDHFYTSPLLFKDLTRVKRNACGTIRTNRKGFPDTAGNDIPKRAERGTIRWIRKDGLLFLKWMDTCEVTMCSTSHKAFAGNEGDVWCLDVKVCSCSRGCAGLQQAHGWS